MSVPNTETFDLIDVVNELGGGLTSLQACFDASIPTGFDATYNNDSYAPANSLLRFRNYSDIIQLDVNFKAGVVFYNSTTNRVEANATIEIYERGTTNLFTPTVGTFIINFDTNNLRGLGNDLGKSESFLNRSSGVMSLASLESASSPYDVTLAISMNASTDYDVVVLNSPKGVTYIKP